MAQEYPLPRFHFQVEWGSTKISFTEVTGLVIEREKVEYRHGDSPSFSKIVMPGMLKHSNITMKRGLFANNSEYNKWFNEVTNNRAGLRRDVIIKLLNEEHQPVAVWKVNRCFPVKVTAPDLKSDASEVAIESIEIAHEGLEMVQQPR